MWEWVLGKVIMAQMWKEDELMILIVAIAIYWVIAMCQTLGYKPHGVYRLYPIIAVWTSEHYYGREYNGQSHIWVEAAYWEWTEGRREIQIPDIHPLMVVVTLS